MIDTKDEDALPLVGNLIARTTLRAIPSSNIDTTANVRESRDLSLGLPAIT
jgi:hypothetical protein